MVFAVVIAGLGIGALVSAFAHRGDERIVGSRVADATPVVERTPTPLPVIVPTATATPYRKPTATPKPQPTPTMAPTDEPSATPSTATASAAPTKEPRPTASPTVTPRAEEQTPTATAMRVVRAHTPSPTPTPTRTPAPTHTAAPTPRAAATTASVPSYARTAAASATATPAPQRVAAVPSDTDAGFSQRAASVVRRYLSDVIGGNSDAASGLLDPSSNGTAESSVLDRRARIVDVHATATGATTAHVEVDIATAKGAYFATYDVSQTAAGPRIMNHEIIKP